MQMIIPYKRPAKKTGAAIIDIVLGDVDIESKLKTWAFTIAVFYWLNSLIETKLLKEVFVVLVWFIVEFELLVLSGKEGAGIQIW